MPKEKTRYEISADELEHRMQQKQKYNVDPAQKAVKVLEAAIDSVLKKLGVDVTADNVAEQMNALGIVMTEETREDMAGLNGFFIFTTAPNDLVPYAWVGSAAVDSDGKCWCEIHWFQREQMSKEGGVKVAGLH